MDIEKLRTLIEAVEGDATVPDRQYVFDGDPETWPQSIKDLEEFCDSHFIGRKVGLELQKEGFDVSFKHDCICLICKKGVINTGSDNM